MESVGEIVEELRSRLVELADGKLSGAAIDSSRHLFDHGYVDSLSAVMLLAFVEERWGVEIEDTELLGECCTLDAIARRIAAGA
jgi:acyl carrier protein